jgi:hypothetical protein
MKKYLMIVVAIILTVGISAFVAEKPGQDPKPFVSQWFDFTGTSSSQYSNVAYYTADPNHVNPCSGSGLRCEILAPVRTDVGHEGEPDLSAIEQETKKP